MTDESVKQFTFWLETRTHCPKPRDIARRVPLLWNEAAAKIDGWPKSTLTRLSFKVPLRRLAWESALVAYLSEITEKVIREEVHREIGDASASWQDGGRRSTWR